MSSASSAAPLGATARRAAAELPLPAERVVARARGENFPVALRVLPTRLRTHLLAIYGFARLADDLGDEAPGDRLAHLDALDRELDAIFAGAPPGHPLLRRLAGSVRDCTLPEAPLRRLVEANRRDQRVARQASWAELADYCRYSANPVGELVLHVLGAASPERVALSDSICTALQLVEHCQDVAEDRARGRVYLPADELARFGVGEADLDAPSASPALRAVVRLQVERARTGLRAGEPLLGALSGWGRLAVAGFVAGGDAALDAVERAGCDVLAQPVAPRRRDLLWHAVALLWRTRR